MLQDSPGAIRPKTDRRSKMAGKYVTLPDTIGEEQDRAYGKIMLNEHARIGWCLAAMFLMKESYKEDAVISAVVGEVTCILLSCVTQLSEEGIQNTDQYMVEILQHVKEAKQGLKNMVIALQLSEEFKDLLKSAGLPDKEGS